MYETFDVSALASRKITTRFPAERMEPSVGHERVSAGVDEKDGTKARSARPALLKLASHTVTSMPSWFVSNKVTTSFGFASSHDLTFDR